MDKIEELLTRGVANVIPNIEELKKLLGLGKKLTIYLGIDPTATKIHLGHAVALRKLQAFAELGHNVVFLIGDFTALIGDTSDKDTERPVLTQGEIEENFQTYKKQAEKILDFSKVQVRRNSEWLSKLDFKKVVELTQQFDFGEFASRELIANRLRNKKHVGLHEALYPVMQGYDSYFMDTDIQIGGTDQTFNMQSGRTLQKKWRNKESCIVAMEFLIGTDGRKMSKSWGNAIWLEDTPEEMYGKVMAIDDSLISQYFRLGTNMELDEINKIMGRIQAGDNPRDVKKTLAFHLVSELHGTDKANIAQQYFERTVQKKEMPTDIPTIAVSTHDALISYVDLLLKTNLAVSRSEAKRLIEQGGVEVDNERITDTNGETTLKDGIIVQVGKRKFVKITME